MFATLLVVSLCGFFSLSVAQANTTAAVSSTTSTLSCSVGEKDCTCRPDGSCNDPLQCIRAVGRCACVLGSIGCACVDNACPRGGECVDNLCEVAGLPSFVIPVAIVGGIVVLLAVVLVVVIVIRKKKADEGAMRAFNNAGASGFGGTAPAFLSSTASFYDPHPPPPSDFLQRSASSFSTPPTFGSPPPPPLSQEPSYVGHIYGAGLDTNSVGFSGARGSRDQYSNIPADLAAM